MKEKDEDESKNPKSKATASIKSPLQRHRPKRIYRSNPNKNPWKLHRE